MQNKETRSTSRWLEYCVWIVALWTSLLNLLNFNHYPLLRMEVALALAALGLLGALMGWVQHLARPRLSFLFAALFAVVVIDLNTSLDQNWRFALYAGLALVAYFAERPLLKIILAAFTSVMVFQLVALTTGLGAPAKPENLAQNLQAANRAATTRPAIVHLILDSHLGYDGLALGPDEFRELRAEQSAFFRDRGFQVYPGAYSRHSRTMNSLLDLFSYGEPAPMALSGSLYSVPNELPYFDDLDARGYRTSAVLPAYFDLCVNQKLTRCRMFEGSALTSILGTDLDVVDRATVLGFNLLHLADWPSRAAMAMKSAADSLFGPIGRHTYNRRKLFPLASLEEMERFTAELADLRPGEARVAHLLLPHDPYILDAGCATKPEADWLDEHGPGATAARELAYADQMRCVQLRIGRLLDVLDRSAAGREAIVLIHGDHGSRIAPSQPYLGGPELSPREMAMTYSALFAIRVPSEASGEMPGSFALDELMADFRARDFAAAPRPASAPARVLIMDAVGTPRGWKNLPALHR